MLLWFAGMAFVIVWAVFRDTAIDYRLVMAGAVLPDAVDVVFGGPRVLHSLLFSVGLLLIVMAATRHRRVLRRRLLALPIGTFCHLVLDGMWARTHVFWWPFFGASFAGHRLPSLDRPAALLAAQELVGAVALVWAWRRFRLGESERRHQLLSTGRLGRDLRTIEPPTC
ncbi:MAG TPA: metal-dependent hydrolase [Acidimicrobiales bacterium]|nr:metal-dependent hydrolase [Acidimicrobiales bacterium]